MAKTIKRRPPKRLGRGSPGLMLGWTALALAAVALVASAVYSPNGDRAEAAAPTSVSRGAEVDVVPVPLRAIARGERIKDIPIGTISWPRTKAADQYVKDVKLVEEFSAAVPLAPYVPIPREALAPQVTKTNAVMESIPAGMRAITLRVDVESAVEGWAQPGNFVDVVLLRSSGDKTVGVEATVIAERIRILSAGRSAATEGGEVTGAPPPSTVTLLVNQEDALRVKAAASLGKLTFSLRPTSDPAPTNVRYVNQSDVVGDAPTAKPNDLAEPKNIVRDSSGRVFAFVEGRGLVPLADPPSRVKAWSQEPPVSLAEGNGRSE